MPNRNILIGIIRLNKNVFSLWQYSPEVQTFQILNDNISLSQLDFNVYWMSFETLFFFLLPLPHYNSIKKKKKSSLLIRVQSAAQKNQRSYSQFADTRCEDSKKTTSTVHKILQIVLLFNELQSETQAYMGNSVRGKEGEQKKKVNAALLYYLEGGGGLYLFIYYYY